MNLRFLIADNDSNSALPNYLQFELEKFGTVSRIRFPQTKQPDLGQVVAFVTASRPNVIINTVSFNRDIVSLNDKNLTKVFNIDLPLALYHGTQGSKGIFLHVSDSSVFNSLNVSTPWLETDMPNPVSFYGKTRAIIEQQLFSNVGQCILVRLGTLLDSCENNRISSLLTEIFEKRSLKINPFSKTSVLSPKLASKMLTKLILQSQVNPQLQDLYHLANNGSPTENEIVELITSTIQKIDPTVKLPKISLVKEGNTGSENSCNALDCTKFQDRLGVILPDWRDSVIEATVATTLKQRHPH